ncbi:MAG: hypothetical protein FD146_437 [Anaerolineaceae bacterium]|nr:MAG: hypothetical protein FD146_437 [Anaerolineaceae bacterium]
MQCNAIALAALEAVGIALFLQQGYLYSTAAPTPRENPVFVDVGRETGIHASHE